MEARNERNIAAYILLGLGVFLLLNQLNLGFNWWALFIALPGGIMLRNVARTYRQYGELDSNELIQGMLGLFLLALGGGFLVGVNLFSIIGTLWPLALITLGLYMIFR